MDIKKLSWSEVGVFLEGNKIGELKEDLIQNKLENEMYSRISQTGNCINLIVMHPQTWIELKKEVFEKYSTAICRFEPLLKYKGIKVLRSLDMAEGAFELC